jgi:aminopeptidase C
MWEMDIVYKSPLIQDILSESYQRGYKQSYEETIEEARKDMLDALQQLLAFRFGVTTAHFDSQFQSKDLKALTQLHQTALQVQTLAEFENALQ